MKNFLLPWLNVEKSPLGTLPNNPLNKLEQSSSFNTPDGGFLHNKAPMTPIPRMSRVSKQNLPVSAPKPQRPMSFAPVMLREQHSIPEQSQLPSFTDFQNQNFIPDPLRGFTPTYNTNKPKLEIPTEKKDELDDLLELANAAGSLEKITDAYLEDRFPFLTSNSEAWEYLKSDIGKIASKEKSIDDLKKVYNKHFPWYLEDSSELTKNRKRLAGYSDDYVASLWATEQEKYKKAKKETWIIEYIKQNYELPSEINDDELLRAYQKQFPNEYASLMNNEEVSNSVKVESPLTMIKNDFAEATKFRPYEEWDSKEEKIKKSIWNSLNFIPRIAKWTFDLVAHPIKTLEMIARGASGAGINGAKALIKIFSDLTEEELDARLNSTKIGRFLKENEDVADAFYDAVFWKYEEAIMNGNFDRILEDPLAVIWDIATAVGMMIWGLGKAWAISQTQKAELISKVNAMNPYVIGSSPITTPIEKGIDMIWKAGKSGFQWAKFQAYVEKWLGTVEKPVFDPTWKQIWTKKVFEWFKPWSRGRIMKAWLQEMWSSVRSTFWIKEKPRVAKKTDLATTDADFYGKNWKYKDIPTNDLNTKSQLKQEAEIKVWSAWSEGKINTKNSNQNFSNFNRKLLQNQNRIDPSKIVEFEKRTGQKYGDYMIERGWVGWPEENVAKMIEYRSHLKQQKRQAFEKMSGKANLWAIEEMLNDSVERAIQVRDKQAWMLTKMQEQYHQEWGISFSELEDLKEWYERNIKTWYYKENNSIGIQRATNLDTEIREYQQQEAIKQWFTNVKEINKEISNAYFLSDNILKKQLKMDANNQVSLTDYLLLWAIPDNAAWFAGLALKIAMKNKSVKNTMLHAVARLFKNHKNSKEIKVDLEKIGKMADQKSVADAIEKFMKKWNIEEPKALPKIASATVIGKNWPQVKNPLTPQPTRRSVIELDKRSNMLWDTIPRNSKKIDKKPENIIGLKQQKTPSVQFSEGIEKLSKGELPVNRTLSLGEPQGKLKEVLWNDDLFVTQRTLKTKLKQHQLSFDDLQGLDKALSEPVVIYEAGQHAKSIIVVTDLNKGNEKIAVAIGYDRKGWAEVNEIKSIHPKDLNRLLDEAEGGKINKLHFEDTKKLQAWLGSVALKEQQPTTIAWRMSNDNLFLKKSKWKNILWDTKVSNKTEKTDFEVLPSDVSVLEESRKLWPKRIAPDRKAHQQLDPQIAMEKLAEAEKKLRDSKIENLQQDLEKYRSIMKKYDGKLPARTEKNRAKYPDLIREYGEIQQLKKQYLLAWEITKSQNIEQTIEGMIAFNKSKIESITPERMKERYIELVQQDLSKGYKYPEAVLNFIPEARKILNGRERYEKGLHTSFSAKDERINYDYKDQLGVGMKRQDGKELTLEQKQDIVEGVKDFEEALGLDMKKLGEEKQWVYVHLNGKNVFLKNGVGGLYREKGENISISVGGTETVRQTLGGGASSIKVHTVMSHELGHALDAIQNWNLFPNSKLFDLKIKMNKAPNWNIRYWKSDAEITARAIEQYVGIKKGNTNYYEKPAYWKKELYETIIEPMIKESIEKKFKGYKKGDNQTWKSLPKGSHEWESAMIWVSDKTSKKIQELTEKYPSAGKNELAKMEKLNSKIKKWSWKRTDKDKEIYRVKDDILLDDIIEKWISIKDEWPNTTYTLEQDGVYVTWHLWDRVMRILREKWLLK